MARVLAQIDVLYLTRFYQYLTDNLLGGLFLAEVLEDTMFALTPQDYQLWDTGSVSQ